MLDIAQTAQDIRQQSHACGILALSVSTISGHINLQAKLGCAAGQGWLLALLQYACEPCLTSLCLPCCLLLFTPVCSPS